jgi:hypothetical protein
MKRSRSDQKVLQRYEQTLDRIAIGPRKPAKAVVDRLLQIAKSIVIHMRKFKKPFHSVPLFERSRGKSFYFSGT